MEHLRKCNVFTPFLMKAGNVIFFSFCDKKAHQRITRKGLFRWFINLNLFVIILTVINFLVHQHQQRQITLHHPYILHTLSSQSEHLGSWLANGSTENIQDGYPPVNVHYLWCRKGHFEFKHYLSMLSILRTIQPDQVIFHYTYLPLADPKGYVTWFEDIQRDIPFLVFKKISHSKYCGHSFFQDMNFDLAEMKSPTGIFVTDDIAVVNFTRKDFYGLSKSQQTRSMIRAFLFPSSEPFLIKKMDGVGIMECPSIKQYKTNELNCVQITERLSPQDIWNRKEPFYSFVRNLVYGSKSLKPQSHEKVVPLHCHILHFADSDQLDYMAYASVLSALYIGKMKHVYLHSDQIPSGSLYKEIKSNKNLTFVYVPHIRKFNQDMADMIYGVYVLLRHGGILIHSDTIWQKELSQDHQIYDSSATLRRSVYRIINYSLDLNVLISKSNSKFIKLLLSTLRQTSVRHHEANNEEVAYRVYLEDPESLKLQPILIQHVKCSMNLCTPTAEDVGARSATLIQMSWKDGRPMSESDLEHVRGDGVHLLKNMKNSMKRN